MHITVMVRIAPPGRRSYHAPARHRRSSHESIAFSRLGRYHAAFPNFGFIARRRITMADARTVAFKGNPVPLTGSEIKPGQRAPEFSVIGNNLEPVKLGDAKGKVLILNAVPSLDTPICDVETRRFNEEASKLGENVEIWTVSVDTPFAQKRWCGAAGVTRVKTLSDFRDRAFGQAYGVLVKEGPLAGIFARAVFVIGKDGTVKHVEYVPEITIEPTYDTALKAAQQALNG
jgi:thioredoxin-dependent peroxiredoxin